MSRRTQWSFAFPTIRNKKSIVNQRTPLCEFFQQIATRNLLWAEDHNGAYFSNKLQQESMSSGQFHYCSVALQVCARVSADLTIYSWAGSSKLALEVQIQMLKFEEHQGESSTKSLHSIAGMPSFRDFQIILSTKWKTESALAAWRNKRGHVKMEEFIAKWVLEVEIGKFLWASYCSQNTSCPFPSSSGFLTSFAVRKQKPWEREE